MDFFFAGGKYRSDGDDLYVEEMIGSSKETSRCSVVSGCPEKCTKINKLTGYRTLFTNIL